LINVIAGYIINFKREHGDWEEIHIDAKTHFHVLQKLLCGTRYQLYITAYNKIGTGLPCDILTSYTKGSGIYLFICFMQMAIDKIT